MSEFQKCPKCGGEEFKEFALEWGEQGGVRIGKDGEPNHDDAGIINYNGTTEKSYFICEECDTELYLVDGKLTMEEPKAPETCDCEAMVREASALFNGTDNEASPEFLRGMCELIAGCFPTDDIQARFAMSNSLRDEVKDAIVEVLDQYTPGKLSARHYEAAADIADAVFGVIGVPANIQDMPVKALSFCTKEEEVIYE